MSPTNQYIIENSFYYNILSSLQLVRNSEILLFKLICYIDTLKEYLKILC